MVYFYLVANVLAGIYVSNSKWDSVEHRSHCSSWCNCERQTWVVTCILVQAGLLPGLPFTLCKFMNFLGNCIAVNKDPKHYFGKITLKTPSW